MVVETGSMSYKNEANTYLESYDNQIATYSIIGVDKVEKNELKIYDVIAFKNNENEIIIHRIIGIENNRYLTRGDANDLTDSYRPVFEDVIGVYNGFNIPYLGIFIIFLQSNSGIVTVIAILYCLILFGILSDKIEKKLETRKKELLEVIDVDINNKNLNHDFIERIYYKGYVYSFNNNNFIGKEKIKDDDINTPNEESEIITIIEDKDKNLTIKKDKIHHADEEEKV